MEVAISDRRGTLSFPLSASKPNPVIDNRRLHALSFKNLGCGNLLEGRKEGRGVDTYYVLFASHYFLNLPSHLWLWSPSLQTLSIPALRLDPQRSIDTFPSDQSASIYNSAPVTTKVTYFRNSAIRRKSGKMQNVHKILHAQISQHTLSPSCSCVSMTIMFEFCSISILQKSSTVSFKGAWVAIYAKRWR